MKSALIVFVLMVAAVVGLGFYRGWFSVLWDSSDGKGHITGTLDENKIQEDLRRVKDVNRHEKEPAPMSDDQR